MLRKIGFGLITIVISVVVMFVVIYNMPGNPVEIMANDLMSKNAISYEVAYERAKSMLNYDPDVPIMQRFVLYLKGLSTGNLGDSLSYKRPVIDIVKGALPWTLLIVSTSLLLSFIVGILIGIYIAWTRSKALNSVLIVFQSIFGTVPPYIIAYLSVLLFCITLGWLPSRGAYGSDVTPGFNAAFIADVLLHAVLPVSASFLTSVSGWIVAMRANALSVIEEDYMIYARVRGISKKRILINYLGRNAILPMITSLGITFGLLFGGSPLIENMFLYPGVGYYLNLSISRRDFPLIQGMFLMIIVMVVVFGLIAEALYKVLNPRLSEAK